MPGRRVADTGAAAGGAAAPGNTAEDRPSRSRAPRKPQKEAAPASAAPAVAPVRPRRRSTEPEPESGTAAEMPEPVAVAGPLAPGGPGVDPRWAPGAKDAVGTAGTPTSPVWFTIAQGVITEIYYPRVDLANLRDLQFLLAGDEPGAFYEERRSTDATVEMIHPRALAWHVVTTEHEGNFVIDKRVITDPARPSLAMRVRITDATGKAAPAGLRPYLLVAPHVADRGGENTARLQTVGDRLFLMAHRHDTFVAIVCSRPFAAGSAGYVGVSDGWTDISKNRRLTANYASAPSGYVALTGELAADPAPFVVAVGFGATAAEAAGNAAATADADFEALEATYIAGWRSYCDSLTDLSRTSGDGGHQYYLSAMVLAAHEDLENPGAHIASLAIPWGEAQGDTNRAGYHLVWPRDLYHAATARLAAGDASAALRTLHYLNRTQREDGSWPQNFWVFGEPYWHGLQLDEVAFPILLAWQLQHAKALDWNPYPSLVAPAAKRIARVGPVTQQERWEENSGYSPSTLAVSIAALVCAAEFAAADRDPHSARYFLETADYWARHLEEWTYTTSGCLDKHSEYYERIAGGLAENPKLLGRVFLPIRNLPPGAGTFEECAVIDGGFLELVRYGVRRPDDPHVLQTLTVYDDVCRVETPLGPCWHRYSHDGYGQKADGGPYDGSGIGRAWPLLVGERAHYELAADRRPGDLVGAMEAFVTKGGLIPEQVWDTDDIPARGMFRGRPTGSAAPLVWAHAEYIKLLRSIADGAVFDCPAPVRRRYAEDRAHKSSVVIWKHNHKIRAVSAEDVLRLEVYSPAALHWTRDSWRTVEHDPMEPYGHGVWIYDFPKGAFRKGRTLEFTFYWNDAGNWEGTNYVVAVI